MSDAPAMSDPGLILSVSGARGIVGESMTEDVARAFAASFATHLIESTETREPLVCLGRDSRPSGAALGRAASAGLVAAGCRVIDLGVVATPTVSVMVADQDAAGGLVVTASHNPEPWNGLKCLVADGRAPGPEEIKKIIDRYRAGAPGPPDADQRGGEIGESRAANDTHIARVLAAIDPEPIRAARFKVVLDSVNGAGGPAGRALLEALGCEVIHLNGEPTGEFAHEPEPIEENLLELAQTAPSGGCGCAQDPDADRLAVVDETGRSIGEEYTLVLAAKRMLDLHGGGQIVANLSTSRMIDDLANHYDGASVVRTAVGEANVAAAMVATDALIGGEGNGGVIHPGVCWTRDSLSAMALVLSLMAAEARPLSAIVDDLPRYVIRKRKLHLARLGGRAAIAAILQKVLDHYTKAGAKVNTADGVRVDLVAPRRAPDSVAQPESGSEAPSGERAPSGGWVHVRPSNTEPILRLIAEADAAARAEALLDEVATVAGLKPG